MVLATSILLPLYLYPTEGAWNWVTNAIAAYPSLPFTIIVNPDSGPGTTNAYPEDGYIAGITSLTKYDNVKLLGYVDTKFMARSAAAVEQDVETYKYWSTYTEGDIAIDGIFFDDVVSTWTSSSSTYMSAVAANAHALNLTVTFNPGTIADGEFFGIADKIIMIEDSYSSYSSGRGDSVKEIATTQQEKSSVILYDFSGTATQQTSAVKTIVNSGVSEIYITTVQYVSESSLWMQFVAAVDTAVGN